MGIKLIAKVLKRGNALNKESSSLWKTWRQCPNCVKIAIQPSESRKLKVSSSLPQKAIEQQWLIYKFIQLYSIIKNKRKRYITFLLFFFYKQVGGQNQIDRKVKRSRENDFFLHPTDHLNFLPNNIICNWSYMEITPAPATLLKIFAPQPLNNDPTPSEATIFLRQSIAPLYFTA